MTGKKTIVRMILWTAALTLAWATAAAVDFDAEQYSYEELLEIRELVDGRLDTLERERAMENADRAFSFEEDEQVVYLGKTVKIEPTVVRLTEDAPKTTAFVWESSDPEIASVSAKGTVTAEGPGDAVITAHAADNPYLSVSYTVHCAVPVEQITVWGQEEPLLLGVDPEQAETQLGCSVEPEDAYYQEVTWSSSDEAVATVDGNGTVKGLAPGTVTITAASTGDPDRKAEIRITVLQPVTGLGLSEDHLSLPIGTSAALEAVIEPENASENTLVFSSENPEIATVDEAGTVTAVSAGNCAITCETTDGSGLKAVCRVTVTQPVTGLTLSAEELNLAVGSVCPVEAEITPEDATDTALLWTSSNVMVARAADGKIEAVGQGECEITCTTTDGSNLSRTIHVKVPTFSVAETEVTVTEKTGALIPVRLNVAGIALELQAENDFFTAELTEDSSVQINPMNSGSAEITISNPEAPEDTVTVLVSIENSAVFNLESYPAIPFIELARAPGLYDGAQISLHGKVLHIGTEEDELQSLMVGTGGENYTNDVMWVRCDPARLPAGVKEGSMLTVFGYYHMDTSYSEILQSDTMIPAVDAEKVVPDPTEDDK